MPHQVISTTAVLLTGIGYLVERGVALGKPIDDSNGAGSLSSKCKIDMSRLLGRTPKASSDEDKSGVSGAFELGGDQEGKEETPQLSGSGLGSEWDDRVGAGAAAASIVSYLFAFIENVVVCVFRSSSSQ